MSHYGLGKKYSLSPPDSQEKQESKRPEYVSGQVSLLWMEQGKGAFGQENTSLESQFPLQ